ncbi:MAG: hypothetical protein H6508_01760 [Calditrichaeota bacterium]|nr:hypothetical protein [Calditrichota bacterium]
MLLDHDRRRLAEGASLVVREYAHECDIYGWMKANGVGESAYGRLLDLLGRNQGVFQHRLFGHHPIYDFPILDPQHVGDFIEHVYVSDFFTRQGLPIVPGEVLRDAGVLKYCSAKTLEWNFVNAFDLLAGTLAIYNGYRACRLSYGEYSAIDDFRSFAKQAGVGIIELALAVSHSNPFLLFGAALHLAATVRGLANDSVKVYFRRATSGYLLIVSEPHVEIDKAIQSYYPVAPDSKNDLPGTAASYYPG